MLHVLHDYIATGAGQEELSTPLPAGKEAGMSDHFEATPAPEEHRHDALLHSHRHFHVTHNHNRLTGGFDHLYSEHEHEHDHAQLTHSHVPHQDFESEHQGEAHVHDHLDPTHRQQVATAAIKPAAAPGKGAAKSTKKAAKKKAG